MNEYQPRAIGERNISRVSCCPLYDMPPLRRRVSRRLRHRLAPRLRRARAYNDLADLSVGLHELDRRRQILESEHLIDQRTQTPVLQVRQDVPDEAANRLGALGGAAELVAYAEQREAFAVQGLKVERACQHPVEMPHHRKPA